MTKPERNERSADLVAKLIAAFLVFVIGYSVGYFQAAKEASRIILSNTAETSSTSR